MKTKEKNSEKEVRYYLTQNGNILNVDKKCFQTPKGELLRFLDNDEIEYLQDILIHVDFPEGIPEPITNPRKGRDGSTYVDTPKNLTVHDIIVQINELLQKKEEIENKLVNKNIPLLRKEIRNLLNCVGDGFVEGDYYANSRYYSKIPGVKNIREAGDDGIWVKVTSRNGYLLPNEIEVDGKLYKILFTQSKNYKEKLNY